MARRRPRSRTMANVQETINAYKSNLWSPENPSGQYVYYKGNYKDIRRMSDKDWGKYYAQYQRTSGRKAALSGLQHRGTTNQVLTGDRLGVLGSTRTGSNNIGTGSNTGNNLFGSTNSLWGGNYLGNSVNTSKDLARFQLELDKEQAEFSKDLREQEAQQNFGRTFKLQEQQIGGQKDLEGLRQTSTTERLEKELANRQRLQQEGFDFTLLKQGKERAAALRGIV